MGPRPRGGAAHHPTTRPTGPDRTTRVAASRLPQIRRSVIGSRRLTRSSARSSISWPRLNAAARSASRAAGGGRSRWTLSMPTAAHTHCRRRAAGLSNHPGSVSPSGRVAPSKASGPGQRDDDFVPDGVGVVPGGRRDRIVTTQVQIQRPGEPVPQRQRQHRPVGGPSGQFCVQQRPSGGEHRGGRVHRQRAGVGLQARPLPDGELQLLRGRRVLVAGTQRDPHPRFGQHADPRAGHPRQHPHRGASQPHRQQLGAGQLRRLSPHAGGEPLDDAHRAPPASMRISADNRSRATSGGGNETTSSTTTTHRSTQDAAGIVPFDLPTRPRRCPRPASPARTPTPQDHFPEEPSGEAASVVSAGGLPSTHWSVGCRRDRVNELWSAPLSGAARDAPPVRQAPLQYLAGLPPREPSPRSGLPHRKQLPGGGRPPQTRGIGRRARATRQAGRRPACENCPPDRTAPDRRPARRPAQRVARPWRAAHPSRDDAVPPRSSSAAARVDGSKRVCG